MFCQLVRNDIYQDNSTFIQQIIKLKSRFMLQNVERFEKELERFTLEEIEEKDMKAIIKEAEEIVLKRRMLSQRSLVSHRSLLDQPGEEIASEYNTVKQIASLFEHILPKDEEI